MQKDDLTHRVVVILMATYNGAAYIDQQLNSILDQSFTNWILVIRDDGSTDDTLAIINTYLHHSQIQIITTESNGRGACSNFAALYSWALKNLQPAYLMFCDQDDIWLENKIEKTLTTAVAAEKLKPLEPVMVYGNLAFITAGGAEIKEEMKLKKTLTLNDELAQNYAFGCTILMNKELINLVYEIPAYAENHDYWVCLVATAFGKTIYINDKLIAYRQHAQNVTSQGAGFIKRINRFTVAFKHQIETLKKTIVMLNGFLNQYKNQLKPAQIAMLQSYTSAYKKSRWHVLQAISKHKIYKLGLLQNAGFLYTIIGFYAQVKNKLQQNNY